VKLPFLPLRSSEIKRSTHSEKLAAVPAETEIKPEKLADTFFFAIELYLMECRKKKGGLIPALLIKFGGADGSRTHGL
jgi:hypothetical protein